MNLMDGQRQPITLSPGSSLPADDLCERPVTEMPVQVRLILPEDD